MSKFKPDMQITVGYQRKVRIGDLRDANMLSLKTVRTESLEVKSTRGMTLGAVPCGPSEFEIFAHKAGGATLIIRAFLVYPGGSEWVTKRIKVQVVPEPVVTFYTGSIPVQLDVDIDGKA